ncbi:MAG: hypothetical protein DMG12_01680 [Acidobacteria bacterium]|nr:MAG: hypothetical protein DMG12_01680 [Acidobacteriota bacterium]
MPLRLARAVQDPERLKQSMLSPAKNSRSRWQGRIFNSTSRFVDVLLFFPRTEPVVAEDKEVEVLLKLDRSKPGRSSI